MGRTNRNLSNRMVTPNRDAQEALGNELRGWRGGDDARQCATLTGGLVALALDDPPVGLHLDFDGFGVFGAGEGCQGQTTHGTTPLLLRDVPDLLSGRQMRVVSAAMSLAAGLLAARFLVGGGIESVDSWWLGPFSDLRSKSRLSLRRSLASSWAISSFSLASRPTAL